MIGQAIVAALVGLAVAWAGYCWWMEFVVADGGERTGETPAPRGERQEQP